MLYALQGVLQYVSYQHLDSVTFNGLTQTKTLSAALCCWLVMGKTQSPVQMIALVILFVSALVFQGYLPRLFQSKQEEDTLSTDDSQSSAKKPSTEPLSTKSTTTQPNDSDEWVWRGIVPCLGAAFLSGLAGSLSQKGLQLTGISGRDPFLYTIEISFFSAVTLLVNMFRSNTFASMEWQKQRQYWTWQTLIPIVVKATGGFITALVHKYAGSVSKGFALMFGLVLSNMIQLTEKQDSLKDYQIIGTILIMISTWLHFTH
jgi:solute carrier family 35 (UDP-sugar transporter), member A1/2/3